MGALQFSKWEGTGNDFILIDDRDAAFPSDDLVLVRRLCDRHFGIGSDGLILVRPGVDVDYDMEFFNPDGSRSFCGNGSRCAFAFHSSLQGQASRGARQLIRFKAIDGMHTAQWEGDQVRIGMRDVVGVEHVATHIDLIHTGSPHLLIWVDDPDVIDLLPAAHEHRHGARFKSEGVNVNFLTWRDGHLHMRTYERGVEAETLSCGTGVTAAALDAMHRGLVQDECEVRTRGGVLRVNAKAESEDRFVDIALTGPVREVYRGEANI